MHWFWRAVIAVLMGLVVDRIFFFVPLVGIAPPPWATASQRFLLAVRASGPFELVSGLLPLTVPLVAYGLLTRFLSPKHARGETRCRQCDYILRGITEPRCPECGERI